MICSVCGDVFGWCIDVVWFNIKCLLFWKGYGDFVSVCFLYICIVVVSDNDCMIDFREMDFEFIIIIYIIMGVFY